MDENYLDDLLNDISNKGKSNDDFDNAINSDVGLDIDFSDIDNISLEELDGFDDLTLDDLEVDDIDFDDVDVTKLSDDANNKSKVTIEPEKYDLNDLIDEANASSLQKDYVGEEVKASDELDDSSQDVFTEAKNDMDLDWKIYSFDNEEVSLMSSKKDDKSSSESSIDNSIDNLSDVDEASVGADFDSDEMDLDDLFSALGIEAEEGEGQSSYNYGEDDLDKMFEETMAMSADNIELAGIKEIGDDDSGSIDDYGSVLSDEISLEDTVDKKQRKKKTKQKKENDENASSNKKERKSISEILFGTPDEEDLLEEEQFKIKKEQKLIAKEQKKSLSDAKKQEKAEKKQIKEQQSKSKKNKKLQKKQEKEALYKAELEAEKDEKKVPTFVVIIVFLLFAALGCTVVFGAKGFSYSQLIKRASDYFERQRYRLAYDEVAGVEVKPKHENLKERIYTVMYVERLYESYCNYTRVNKYEKGLDALLRGLEKYDEHYEEAVELEIVDDVNYCKNQIIEALLTVYGLDEASAREIMQLTGQDYMEALNKYCKKYKVEEE